MKKEESHIKLYANGLLFLREKAFDGSELIDLRHSLEKSLKLETPGRRFGLYALYLCLFLIGAYLIARFFLKLDTEGIGTPIFLLCCFLPALAGSIHEIFYSRKTIGKIIFAFPIAYALFRLLGPESMKSDLLLIAACLIFIFGGWIFLLLRWSDASKVLPNIKPALKDLKLKKILVFQGMMQDIEGHEEEVTLEILPNSHLIYKVNNEIPNEWVQADVMRLSLTPPNQFLAPWHDAPLASEETQGLKFYQRKMSEEEQVEVNNIRKKFLKKAFISLLPSLYLTAFFVRFVESIINSNFSSELSVMGWTITLILGNIYPLKCVFSWHTLKKDQSNKLIVSVWEDGIDREQNRLLDEVLPESGMLWSSEGHPSGWRLIKKF